MWIGMDLEVDCVSNVRILVFVSYGMWHECRHNAPVERKKKAIIEEGPKLVMPSTLGYLRQEGSECL